jgi:hypothetical protein
MNSLLNSPFTSIVITIAIIILIVYRQIRPRKLKDSTLVIVPGIIFLLILNSLPTFHPSQKIVIETVITSIVSIIFGLLACRSLKVYASEKTGKAMASGSWTYFLWWLGALLIKIGLSIAFGETNFKNINEAELLIPVFFLMATRNVYLYYRTVQLGLVLHSRHE